MEVAAFIIGCVALILSIGNSAWQIYSWRRDRRFDVRLEFEFPGAALGGRRYDLVVVATNYGRTHEAIERLFLKATYDRDHNQKLTFYSPELVADPAADRGLPPNRSFRSTFNLLSRLIGGRDRREDFPTEVVAVVELQSGRQVESEPYNPPKGHIETAFADDPGLSVPDDATNDYFLEGPTRPCPDCRTPIPSDARVCRYCGYELLRERRADRFRRV